MGEEATLAEVVQCTAQALEETTQWCEMFPVDGLGGAAGPCVYGFEYAQLPPTVEIDDISFSLELSHAHLQPFHLKLTVVERDDQLLLEWQYDASKLRMVEIERSSARLATLLSRLTNIAQTPLNEVPIVGPRERYELLTSLAVGAPLAPPRNSIVEVIDEQNRAAPARLAVVDRDRAISYGELCASADAVARELRSLNVRVGDRVAIYCDRSIETIVGALGILKAGAAFVPLDAVYPVKALVSGRGFRGVGDRFAPTAPGSRGGTGHQRPQSR